MILRELRDFIREQGQVPLLELRLHFGVDEATLRDMLRTLEAKGLIRKLPAGTACAGGCTRCAPDTVEIYAWNG